MSENIKKYLKCPALMLTFLIGRFQEIVQPTPSSFTQNLCVCVCVRVCVSVATHKHTHIDTSPHPVQYILTHTVSYTHALTKQPLGKLQFIFL